MSGSRPAVSCVSYLLDGFASLPRSAPLKCPLRWTVPHDAKISAHKGSWHMVPMKTASPPAVDRAFAILEELAQSGRGLRLREIATRLGAPRSSTHSLLVAMERRGYLERSESSGRYRFGVKVF